MASQSLLEATIDTPVEEIASQSAQNILNSFQSFFSSPNLIKYAPTLIISTIFFLITYIITKNALQVKSHQTKRLSWILTFFSAIISGPLALYPTATLFLRTIELRSFPVQTVFTSTPLSTFLTLFFLVYLFLDIVLGIIYYIDTYTLLSWLHHIGYTMLLVSCLYKGYSNAFALFLVSEIPTIILSLNNVMNDYRQDLLFGGLFFTIRVLYHCALSCLITFTKWTDSAAEGQGTGGSTSGGTGEGQKETGGDPKYHVWLLMWIILVLHVYWFAMWVKHVYIKKKLHKEMMDMFFRQQSHFVLFQQFLVSSKIYHQKIQTALHEHFQTFKSFALHQVGPGFGRGGERRGEKMAEREEEERGERGEGEETPLLHLRE